MECSWSIVYIEGFLILTNLCSPRVNSQLIYYKFIQNDPRIVFLQVSQETKAIQTVLTYIVMNCVCPVSITCIMCNKYSAQITEIIILYVVQDS